MLVKASSDRFATPLACRNSGGNGAGNGAGQHSVGDAGVYKRGGGYVDERSFKNYPFGSMPICE